jgi:hypothetical protein
MEWASGPDRLRRVRRGLDERRVAALDRAARSLAAELQRRTGPDFDLHALAVLYADAERWAPDLIQAAFAGLRIPLADAPLLDAAFDRHSRMARDVR